MPKLSVQEGLLPGKTVEDRLAAAAQLNIDAVEFPAADLDARLPRIAEALDANGIKASGINMGRQDGCLSADPARRAGAVDALREALTCAFDLEADYVAFAPQCGESDLPDLSPYASPMELQKELLIWLLRGLSDLADAMDVRLALQPLNHYETAFITRLDQAAHVRRQVDDHPKITVAANLYHMALEEENLVTALREHSGDISVIYLSENNRRLPGQGILPFLAIGEALAEMAFDSWLVLEGAETTEDPERARQTFQDLSGSIRFLRGASLL
ncbi:MAG: sugar phosphate isomerase/epimerase [Chloroflexota bacterium]|nr:sugar phosphate isomerase/epimerase [Chloroflexota bacterium]